VEAIVRMFFGDQGTVDGLSRALQTTSALAREMLDDMHSYVADYLETGGPFPNRLHAIALAADLVTDLLARIEGYCNDAAREVEEWETTVDLGMTPATRARLEKIFVRTEASPSSLR
jgi:hypothetical protein